MIMILAFFHLLQQANGCQAHRLATDIEATCNRHLLNVYFDHLARCRIGELGEVMGGNKAGPRHVAAERERSDHFFECIGDRACLGINGVKVAVCRYNEDRRACLGVEAES